jgi:hypothetical protein
MTTAFDRLVRQWTSAAAAEWGYREPTDEYFASIAQRVPPGVRRLVEAGHDDALRQCPAGWWALRVDPRCLLAAVDRGDGASIAGGLEQRHGAFGEVAAVT